MTKFLWDLSHYDFDRHPVSLADAKRAGISGVTCKATEGDWYVDPNLDDFGRQLLEVDFAVAGSYHVLHRGGLADQVDFWYRTVNAKIPHWRDHACWIWQVDAERWKDGNPTPAEVEEFADRTAAKVGCEPTQVVVYGPGWVYGATLARLSYHLWQSAYGANPALPYRKAYPGDQAAGWDAYSGQVPIILQFGSRTTIGQQHTCDANAVRVDTDEALQALFLGDDMATAHDVWAESITANEGKPDEQTHRARTWLTLSRQDAHDALAAARDAKQQVADLADKLAGITAGGTVDLDALAEAVVAKLAARLEK